MDLLQLAGLYFLGSEAFTSSNSMMATIVFKEKLDSAKLFQSYQALIRDYPVLQTKIIESPESNRFDWSQFSPDEMAELLQFEREQLTRKRDMTTFLKEYYPANTRLPFNISVIDDQTAVVMLNHAVANGNCLVYWIQKWLEYYFGSDEAGEVVRQPVQGSGKLGASWIRGLKAFLWVPVFLGNYLFKAGNQSGRTTVDLSYGNLPDKGNNYAMKSYQLSRADTEKILQRCKSKKMTLTEYMTFIVVRGLFRHAPGKKRVLISMPMDLQPLAPYLPESAWGNRVASLPMQFFDGPDIEKQVKSIFKWFKRGVPYSLACLIAAFSISYKKAKIRILEMCKMPVPERGPLLNFTLTYSNLGVISYPSIEKAVEAIYFSFKSQTIFFVTATISGRLCLNVSLSKDLYDAEEVFGFFDKVLAVE